MDAFPRTGLKRVRENSSFAPSGLNGFPPYPRLAPWAAFLRRFAADKGKSFSRQLKLNHYESVGRGAITGTSEEFANFEKELAVIVIPEATAEEYGANERLE